MSGESGRWVSRADSRRKNRAERRVGAAPRRRAAALANSLEQNFFSDASLRIMIFNTFETMTYT